MSKYIKNLFSISFFLLLIAYYYGFIKGDILNIKQTFSEMTVYENTDYTFNDYYLEFNNNINTKNFNKVFKQFDNLEYDIKKIYPSVNTSYNETLNNKLIEYSYDNMDNFINYYIKNLEKYNLENDINNINVYGLKIDKILIYTTHINIIEISKSIEGSKYKNS